MTRERFTTLNTKKTYILDVSVLLSVGKRALSSFEGADIIIPLPVIRELEYRRKEPLEGYTARSVLKAIEKLRVKAEQAGTSLYDGIEKDESGGKIRIEINHASESADLPASIKAGKSVEDRTLIVSKNLMQDYDNLVLVSNNLTMRIIAQGTFKMNAVEFLNPSFQGDFTGFVQVPATPEQINAVYRGESFTPEDFGFDNKDHGANTGLVLRDNGGSKQSALVYASGGKITPLKEPAAFDIKGRSKEQHLALQYLLDSQIPIVSLGGPAGTGKTLLALAAAFEQVLETRKYRRIIVFRPVTAVGEQNLGFLPGTEAEKMDPWSGAIYDALDSIMPPGKGERVNPLRDEIESRNILDILPVTHIRGRNLKDTFIIIDEAQNLDRNTLLSLLARVATNSKVVFSWDAAQKDNPNLGRHDGIVSLVDSLRHEQEFGHVTLQKSERSKVAEMASRLLESD